MPFFFFTIFFLSPNHSHVLNCSPKEFCFIFFNTIWGKGGDGETVGLLTAFLGIEREEKRKILK